MLTPTADNGAMLSVFVAQAADAVVLDWATTIWKRAR